MLPFSLPRLHSHKTSTDIKMTRVAFKAQASCSPSATPLHLKLPLPGSPTAVTLHVQLRAVILLGG